MAMKIKRDHHNKAANIGLTVVACFSVLLICGAATISSFVDDYIIIRNQEEFENISFGLDKKYKLLSDIVFDHPIKMIGDKDHPFTGTFDGGGAMIRGFKMTNQSLTDIDGTLTSALFYCNKGTIKNLKINTGEVDISKPLDTISVSSIAIENYGTLSHLEYHSLNSDCSINISAKDLYFGLICNNNYSMISNSHIKINARVYALNNLNASFAAVNNYGQLKTCFSEGNIFAYSNTSTSSSYVGGFTCFDYFGDYSNCYSNVGMDFDCAPGAQFAAGSFVAYAKNDLVIDGAYSFNYLNADYISGKQLTIGGFIGKTDGYPIVINSLSRSIIGWTNPVPLEAFIYSAGYFLGDYEQPISLCNSFYCGSVYNSFNINRLGEYIDYDDVTISKMGWDSDLWSINDNGEIVLNYGHE